VVATVGSGAVGAASIVNITWGFSLVDDGGIVARVALNRDCWETMLLGMGAKVKPMLEHVKV